jgi:hypothetical protein
MLNRTLSSLVLCRLYICPVLSFSPSSHSNIFSCRSSHFSLSFHPVMHSASATTAHRLSRTTSSNFLSRAVQLDSFQLYRNELFRQERSSLGFDDAVFDCCRFIGIKSPSNSGGAVMSFRALVIFNCLFENCLGRDGGFITSEVPAALASLSAAHRPCTRSASDGNLYGATFTNRVQPLRVHQSRL